MRIFTKYVIKCNDKIFKDRIISTDIFSNINLLFRDENINNYKTIYNNVNTLFAIDLLNHTVNYTNILSYETFHSFFSLFTFNNKEFMNFDFSCIKCLNLFDSMEESKNFLGLNAITNGKNNFILGK